MLHQIQINAQQYSSLRFQESQLEACFMLLEDLEEFSVPPGELSIVFMDDESIGKLHDEYLSDPTPTDVITFDGDSEMEFAGEICVSVDHALAGAQEHDTTFSEELTLYIIHGFLHLAGQNDIEEADRLRMRAAEAIVMQTLRNHDAIPEFRIQE